jgi:hypothetical protein
VVPSGSHPSGLDAARHCPFKIYCVKESDGASRAFLAPRAISPTGQRWIPTLDRNGNKGFTVFRKGGDGAVFTKYEKRRARLTWAPLGLLPGRVDFQTRTTETAEDFLAQR